MQNKNLVEEALIQMKNVEEAIAENAKGILASTMKEEINQLVKESLSEQDEVDVDVETDEEPTDLNPGDESDTDEMPVGLNLGDDSDTDELPVGLDLGDESDIESEDLTKLSDEELFKVFKRMNPDDKITVVKDGENIHLKDDNADVEYLVKMDETKNEKPIMKEEMDEATIDDIMASLFPDDEEEVEDEEEIMYEIEFNEESDEELDETSEEDESMMDEETDEELDEAEDMDEETDEELDEAEEMDEETDEELDEAEDMDEAEEMDEETDEELDEIGRAHV